MRWGIGILTWNAPEVCRGTIEVLIDELVDWSPGVMIVVLDNGSEPPLPSLPPIHCTTVRRHPTNLGAGGGLTQLVHHLLKLTPPIDAVLFLEDDWELVRPLSLAAIAPLLEDPDVGQLRLGERLLHPGRKYYAYGLEGDAAEGAALFSTTPFVPYAHGFYQAMPSLWSNNPFACRRDVAERFLLTGLDELRMAQPYYDSGLWTRSTTPGHFRHQGGIRDRRDRPGWRK